MVVDHLHHDEGIRYDGTIESMKRSERVTIYESSITPDESDDLFNVYLQRDRVYVNRLFILI
jgi:hypothetical protein